MLAEWRPKPPCPLAPANPAPSHAGAPHTPRTRPTRTHHARITHAPPPHPLHAQHSTLGPTHPTPAKHGPDLVFTRNRIFMGLAVSTKSRLEEPAYSRQATASLHKAIPLSRRRLKRKATKLFLGHRQPSPVPRGVATSQPTLGSGILTRFPFGGMFSLNKPCAQRAAQKGARSGPAKHV
jgi:hypothetical protein